MRNQMWAYVDFAFFDRTGIQKYLEKKALQGWMVKDAAGVIWEFERIEPKKLHFSVVYFPDEKSNDVFAEERREDFVAYCQHSGWELAAMHASMLIWYHTEANPVPIETDSLMELDMIHKTAKKEHLSQRYIGVFAGTIFLVPYMILFPFITLEEMLDNMWFYYGVYAVVKGIWNGFELIHYYTWRKRARLAAQLDGSFVETRSFPYVNTVLRIGMICALLLHISALSDLPVGYVAIGLAIFIVCIVLTRPLMSSNSSEDEESKKTKTKRIVELFAIFATMILIAIMFAVLIVNTVFRILQ